MPEPKINVLPQPHNVDIVSREGLHTLVAINSLEQIFTFSADAITKQIKKDDTIKFIRENKGNHDLTGAEISRDGTVLGNITLARPIPFIPFAAKLYSKKFS